jgi:hypothetical protein
MPVQQWAASYLRLIFRQYKWAYQTGQPAKDYLIVRYELLIIKRQEELKAYPFSNLTEEVLSCIDAIGEQEGDRIYLPRHKVGWTGGEGIPRSYRKLWHYLHKLYGDRIKALSKQLETVGANRAKQKRVNEDVLVKDDKVLSKEWFDKHRELIDKFLTIAERKVSLLDDYGEENWEVLPVEIVGCLKKIAQREGLPIHYWRTAQKLAREGNPDYLSSLDLGESYQLLGERLDQLFREYHQEPKAKSTSSTNFDDLSGVEFETRIAKTIKERGFLDVRGTAGTGDQRADLITKMES